MSRYRLLMVDDRPEQYERMKAVFAPLAGEVGEFAYAAHAAEALAQCGPRRDAFDLVLLDQEWHDDFAAALLTDLAGAEPPVAIPERHRQGFGILRYLRRHGVKVPMIFCSAVATPQAMLEALDAGAVSYYAKADLLADPTRALHVLQEGAADLAFVRRQLRQHDIIEENSLALRWLVGRRDLWRRQWPTLVEALLTEAASAGIVALDAQGLQRLIEHILPRLLDRCREPVTEPDLQAFLAQHGGPGPWTIRHLPPCWWAVSSEPGGPCLAIPEPTWLARGVFPPADWSTETAAWHQAQPAVQPARLERWPLGPADPFWDCDQLVAVTPQQSDRRWQPWPEQAEAGQLVPLTALAGRIGSPGQHFWDHAITTCQALESLQPLVTHTAFLPPLLGLQTAASGQPPDGLALLPFPCSLLRPEALQQWSRPPRQQLLYLHCGELPPSVLAPSQLQARLRNLPQVEVWRSGWPHPFEEEVLWMILRVLEDMPSAEPRSIWINGEFLHVRSGSRLSVQAREYDILLLAPQGILVLECKASVDPRDLLKGHVQIKEPCEFLWATANNRIQFGGIFLLPLLLDRLNQRQLSWDRQRKQLLRVVPPDLADRLRGAGHPDAARDLISDYYRDLASLHAAYKSRDQKIVDTGPVPGFVRPENRDALPLVLGYVVAPEAYGQRRDGTRQAVPSFLIRRDSELCDRVRSWLQLPSVFTSSQYKQVRAALLHMSQGAEVVSLQDFEGFLAERRRPSVGSWQVLDGQTAWTGQPQTVLMRRLERSDLASRTHYGRWLAHPLRHVSGDLRWLDVRGLPANHERHLYRLALVFPGELLLSGELVGSAGQSVSERLEAVLALFELGSEPAVAELLGEATSPPTPLAQRLLPQTPLRLGWLPGEPPRRTATVRQPGLELRRGLVRVLEALLPLLQGLGDHPASALADRLLKQALVQTRDARCSLPSTDELRHALRLSCEVARLT